MAGSGLEGIVVAQTKLSKIDGEAGTLVYGGYTIEDLAEHATFEEVCHLLWLGELPTQSELDDLRREIAREYELPDSVLELVRSAPKDAHPMAVLRTAVSALGLADPEAEDMSRESNLRKSIRLVARLPVITAATARVREGKDPVAPRSDLGIGANLLYMLNGEEPTEHEARTMDVALTLHAEHGLNASTFSARVTVATLADLYSAVTSAIGTLKGPLHGGANERVMQMLEEIGDTDNADAWVRGALERKGKIMGFGHRVYRAIDPRAPILRQLGEELGSSKWFDISDRVREVMRDGDGQARQADLRKRRLLQRVRIRQAGGADIPFHQHFRLRPALRLDGPHPGTARRQPADPPQGGVHRPREPFDPTHPRTRISHVGIQARDGSRGRYPDPDGRERGAADPQRSHHPLH